MHIILFKTKINAMGGLRDPQINSLTTTVAMKWVGVPFRIQQVPV
jgi:hypothetical protein